MAGGKVRKVIRDSRTGEFTTKRAAKRRPATTQTEAVSSRHCKSTIEHAVKVLNSLLALDRRSIEELVEFRVKAHPKLERSKRPELKNVTLTQDGRLGFLGVLNGVLCRGTVRIAVTCSRKGRMLRFEPIVFSSVRR